MVWTLQEISRQSKQSDAAANNLMFLITRDFT